MIRQEFDIEEYWRIIAYYEIDYSLFSIILSELRNAGASSSHAWEMYDELTSKMAKAATFSNTEEHISIILFNKHTTKADFINSIVHEAEHVKQAMLQAYRVEDEGEPPAYTIGYLVSQMYHVFGKLICGYDDL